MLIKMYRNAVVKQPLHPLPCPSRRHALQQQPAFKRAHHPHHPPAHAPRTTLTAPPPMPLALPFRAVFAASAVALSCCTSLLALLKSVLRADCSAPYTGGSSLRPVAISCIVTAALSLAASAAHLVKSRAWSHAAAVCSKWQPVYFLFVSVQRLVLTAVVAYAASAGPCSEHASTVHAVSLMSSCAVLMAALVAMCCDWEAQLPPALRRCTYGLLALVVLLDWTGSVVWGNPLAGNASFSVTESFSILLDNQLTSSIASQVVLALHFVYVSCRSRRGRGWSYASLRFELDECGRSMSMRGLPKSRSSGVESGTAAPMLGSDVSARAQLQPAEAARWRALSRLRQRWLQFQQRQVSRCRVFVIPCVAVLDAGGGGAAGFALARPAFDLRWLRPLQRLADAHPLCYVALGFVFLGVPSVVCAIVFTVQSRARGASNLVFNFFICIMMLGFLSSKRNGLDRVAVKHVAQSFRIAIFFALFAAEVALNIRQVYKFDMHPTEVVASALARLIFCMCIVLDCSPHLSSSAQVLFSVNARVAAHRIYVYACVRAEYFCRLGC
jgi:hypothetical protein